jgi:hypothetical protein
MVSGAIEPPQYNMFNHNHTYIFLPFHGEHNIWELMEAAMNFSSSTLDGELIVLRLPQEQKMFGVHGTGCFISDFYNFMLLVYCHVILYFEFKNTILL